MTAGTLRRNKTRLRQLYEGGSAAAHAFRYALLAFDLVTLLNDIMDVTFDKAGYGGQSKVLFLIPKDNIGGQPASVSSCFLPLWR